MLSRRKFILGSAGAIVGSCAIGGYAFLFEPYWISVTSQVLPCSKIGAKRRIRIVHLSDLHIHSMINPEYVQRVFSIVRDLKPDYVVYTGDYITYVGNALELLASLAPHFAKGLKGTFAVLGNHDYGSGFKDDQTAEKICRTLEGNGISILRNTTLSTDDFELIGVDDLWSGLQDLNLAFKACIPEKRYLILNHNPDSVDDRRFDAVQGLVLAGHTHGGQVKPPFLNPPLLPVRNRRYTSGMFEIRSGLDMYISRGIGFLKKVRFNCRPEIVCFDFV